MGIFKYTKGEEELNKVIKMNQAMSDETRKMMSDTAAMADSSIAESEALLRSLGMGKQLAQAKQQAKEKAEASPIIEHKPEILSWDTLVKQANAQFPDPVELEDILTPAEINAAFREAEKINAEFSSRTSIGNKTDLSFLMIATALQTAKALIYPYIAQQFGYGDTVDTSQRPDHKFFEKEHKQAARNFRDKHQANHPNGEWINIAFRSVPYDTIRGSKDVLGVGLTGNDHRLRTLGHDPVLGWIFGTANILTDTMTLNTLQTYRITRTPKMAVTPMQIDPITLLQETYEMIKADKMNLPAAIFAQGAHLKSDVYSKRGLPVPVLSTINESFATELYKSQYDALCFARDAKFVAGSAGISIILDMIIGLIHTLFYDSKKEPDRHLYEVRTKKILLISNMIATSSSVIAACITENPKQLDIGGLLVTIAHLFSDVRFIARVKQEFVESQIQERVQAVLDEVDEMYSQYNGTY